MLLLLLLIITIVILWYTPLVNRSTRVWITHHWRSLRSSPLSPTLRLLWRPFNTSTWNLMGKTDGLGLTPSSSLRWSIRLTDIEGLRIHGIRLGQNCKSYGPCNEARGFKMGLQTPQPNFYKLLGSKFLKENFKNYGVGKLSWYETRCGGNCSDTRPSVGKL